MDDQLRPCSECVNRLAEIECGCSATSSFLTYGVSNATSALHSSASPKEPLTHPCDHRVRLQHEPSSLAKLCSFPSERQKRFYRSRHWDEQGFSVTESCLYRANIESELQNIRVVTSASIVPYRVVCSRVFWDTADQGDCLGGIRRWASRRNQHAQSD
jgi:hypothetical protein